MKRKKGLDKHFFNFPEYNDNLFLSFISIIFKVFNNFKIYHNPFDIFIKMNTKLILITGQGFTIKWE